MLQFKVPISVLLESRQSKKSKHSLCLLFPRRKQPDFRRPVSGAQLVYGVWTDLLRLSRVSSGRWKLTSLTLFLKYSAFALLTSTVMVLGRYFYSRHFFIIVRVERMLEELKSPFHFPPVIVSDPWKRRTSHLDLFHRYVIVCNL